MSEQKRNINRYSPEFRNEAVRFVISSGDSIPKAAAKLGVNQNTLSTWVTHYHKFQNGDDNYFSFAQQAKLKKLEKQLKDLKEENDFLKKASAFFAGIQK